MVNCRWYIDCRGLGNPELAPKWVSKFQADFDRVVRTCICCFFVYRNVCVLSASPHQCLSASWLRYIQGGCLRFGVIWAFKHFFSWTLIHNRQINLPWSIFFHYKNAFALLQVVQGNQRKLAPLCAKDRFRETRPRCEGEVDWGHPKHPFDLSTKIVGWQTHSRVHALDVSIFFVQ